MQYVRINILDVPTDYILHQTNCVTTRPKGLSKTLAQRFPRSCPYEYRQQYGHNPDVPGTVFIAENQQRPAIINLFGQYHPGRPTESETAELRQQYFWSGLEAVMDYLDGREGPVTIAVPNHIGCGLAGGDWTKYEQMLQKFYQASRKKNIDLRLIVCQLPR